MTGPAAQPMDAPLLALDRVTRTFAARPTIGKRVAATFDRRYEPAVVRAVDDVSLNVAEGEFVGLVGESGCGKSTLSRIAAGILAPSSGRVLHRGRDTVGLSGREARRAALAVQMMFQDPMSSLNPRARVAEIIGAAPLHHGIVSRRELPGYVDEMIWRVGLAPAFKARYPHQFSGGQRQRIGIARALAVRPEVLICDEAVAALDVSVQAQVINLVMRLREELELTCLFVSHDLSVVEHLCDRVVVLYLGRVVEEAPTETLFDRPNHPYTQALLAERPTLEGGRRQFQAIRGEIPSPLAPPPGCHFHPRCPHAMERCAREVPRTVRVGDAHVSACHLNDAPPDESARGVGALEGAA